MKIGILALQGCVDPHIAHIEKLGASAIKVRSTEDLTQVDRLIMPGGESTTMLKLLKITGLETALISFAKEKPVWGICAGAILLAKEVSHPHQASLGLVDIHATRNHYGSQLDSFEAEINIKFLKSPVKVQFIRAPLLKPLNDSVEILGQHAEDTILMKQGRLLVSAFHTELGEDSWLHRYFAAM